MLYKQLHFSVCIVSLITGNQCNEDFSFKARNSKIFRLVWQKKNQPIRNIDPAKIFVINFSLSLKQIEMIADVHHFKKARMILLICLLLSFVTLADLFLFVCWSCYALFYEQNSKGIPW